MKEWVCVSSIQGFCVILVVQMITIQGDSREFAFRSKQDVGDLTARQCQTNSRSPLRIDRSLEVSARIGSVNNDLLSVETVFTFQP